MTKQNLENVDQSADIKEAFKIFDRDGNGYIDMKELRMVITRIGQPGLLISTEDADELMKSADLDGNGKLDYIEFARMITDTWQNMTDFNEQNATIACNQKLLQDICVTMCTDENRQHPRVFTSYCYHFIKIYFK